jgi:hypothetical protein
MRLDLRANDELRTVTITPGFIKNANGSVDRFTLDDYTSLIQQIPEPDSTDQVNNELLEGEAQAEAEQPLYRMVNPQDNWYSIVRCEGTESYLEKGDILEAVFDGQAALPAKVIRIQKEKDCFLLTLEFTEQVDKIINKRMLPLRIQKTVEGLLLPEKALMKSKGRQGVYIRDNEEKRFIETSVQAKQDGYAIVESVSDTQALKLHDQVLTDKE